MRQEVTLTGRELIELVVKQYMGDGRWTVEGTSDITLLQNGRQLSPDLPVIRIGLNIRRET